METVGAILSEGEWNSFNGICTEEADFMAQLLGNEMIMPASNFHNAAASTSFWPAHQNNMNIVAAGYVDDNSSMYSSDDTNATSAVYSFSQGSCNYSEGSNVLFPPSGHERYYPNVISQQFIDYCMMTENKNENDDAVANNVIQGDDFLNQDVSNDSIESNDQKQPCEDDKPGKETEEPIISETLKEDNLSGPSEISKKRPGVPVEVQRSKKSMKLKKCSKVHDDNDEDHDNNKSKNVIHVGQRQSSSSCCSEDEYPHESSSGALNSSGKRRAGRGSATDPQSLYARKRRERINERLKILQSLVPNGTKVDISTMLEEAVQYVKFLQLQIKLLSSDDLWMYSPIAYNGMDIGLDWKAISTPKS